MAASENRSKWFNLAVQLTDQDEWVYSLQAKRVIRTNADEFIVSAICVNGHYDSLYNVLLYKYKMTNNRMCTFDELSEIEVKDDDYRVDATWHSSNIAFNNEQQTLYLQHNENIHSWSIRNSHGPFRMCDGTVFSGGKNGAYFLFINNCFHIINMHDRHWIGSIQNKSLNTLHNTIDNDNHLKDAKAIYIPSKQCILLIGGYYNYDGSFSNEVWIYKLKTEKWIKINNISFQRYGFEAVLTSNQRYIVLFGGKKYNDENADDIFVLDIKDDNNWKIKQCKIKCPISGKCIGVRTGGIDSKNNTTVMGFVKECFKLKEFKNLELPSDIISLIAKWYSGEVLHWMEHYNQRSLTVSWNGGDNFEHFGIYLNDILSSLC